MLTERKGLTTEGEDLTTEGQCVAGHQHRSGAFYDADTKSECGHYARAVSGEVIHPVRVETVMSVSAV